MVLVRKGNSKFCQDELLSTLTGHHSISLVQFVSMNPMMEALKQKIWLFLSRSSTIV